MITLTDEIMQKVAEIGSADTYNIEKYASKWEHQMIDFAKKGLINMPGFDQYRKMFNQTYNKVRRFTSAGKDRLMTLRDKARAGDPTARNLFNNMMKMHSWDMKRVGANPRYKQNVNKPMYLQDWAGRAYSGESLPTMENVVNARGDVIRFLKENGDRLEELSHNATSAHKALSEAGGKEPFIRGLNQVVSLPPEYTRQLERSIVYPITQNTFTEIRNIPGMPENLQQTLNNLNTGVNSRPTGGMTTPYFVTKYGPVAKAFTNYGLYRNNNYMVGDMSRIDKKLLKKNPGAQFMPGVNFINMEGRNTFANNVKNQIGVEASEIDKSQFGKDLKAAIENIPAEYDPTTEQKAMLKAVASSNFEAALLPEMLAQTNPKEFHLFNNGRRVSPTIKSDVLPGTGTLPLRGSVMTDKMTTEADLENGLIGNIIKNLENRKDIQAIPLNDYIEGSSTIQHFLKNMKDKEHILPSNALRDMYRNDAIGRNIVDKWSGDSHGNMFYQGDVLEQLLNDTNIGLPASLAYLLPFIR